MPTHTTINGRTIEYEPTALETKFLHRVEAAVTNAAIGEAELRALIYGPENPLLDQQAGYSFVTPTAFESPVFRVLLDLLDRKRVAAGSLDLAKTAARYTLSVTEAADRLGIRDSAVRTAVIEGRLPSWMKDGEIRLSPESVDSYQVSRRGRPPRLLVTCGSKDSASMRIRVIGGELEVSNKAGGLVEGQVTSWEKVGVITGAKRTGREGTPETTYRYWLLEPGGQQRRVELGPFKVVGRFTIAEQKNGKAASEAFHALERPGAT
jgi:excisionase family DNA binding protein